MTWQFHCFHILHLGKQIGSAVSRPRVCEEKRKGNNANVKFVNLQFEVKYRIKKRHKKN